MSSDFDRPEQPTDPRPDGVIVVSTAESPLRFAIRDDVAVSEGLVCLGAYLGDRLIAQDARPGVVAERLVSWGGGQARLVYATAPEGAGLSGYLYALLPAEGLTDLLADLEDDEDEEGETEAPWTVSARAYEAAVDGEEDEDEEDDADEEDEDEEGATGEAQVLVPLGAIKRVYRSHPDSVEAEAADVLAHIVAGEVTTVDAQTVDQFLKGL